MHPALSKGPLFYKTPPFSTFLQKKHFPLLQPPHFISCLRACANNPGDIPVSVKIVHIFESFHVICLFALVDF